MKQFLITAAGVFAGLMIFLVGVPFILISMAASAAGPAPLPEKAVLELDLRDPLSDQSPPGLLAGIGRPNVSVMSIVEGLRRAETDPRVGGRFTFTDRRPDMGDVEHVGTYLEIDRPRRLVFEFAVPAYEPTRTKITLEFAPDGDGCRLTLIHEGVFEEYVKQTEGGWSMILGGLARALGA